MTRCALYATAILAAMILVVPPLLPVPSAPAASGPPDAIVLNDTQQRQIKCYSGGQVIYDGYSDPRYRVYLGSQDDHVSFVEAQRSHQPERLRVGGNCIVRWHTSETPG